MNDAVFKIRKIVEEFWDDRSVPTIMIIQIKI